MILADADISNIPGDTFKWVMATLIVLLGVAVMVITIIVAFRKKKTEIEPQPFEVRKAARRFNHELTEERHAEVNRRLDSHDAEIERLWETFNVENAKIREEVKTNRAHNEELFSNQTEEIHEMENRLRDKIDQMPEKLRQILPK